MGVLSRSFIYTEQNLTSLKEILLQTCKTLSLCRIPLLSALSRNSRLLGLLTSSCCCLFNTGKPLISVWVSILCNWRLETTLRCLVSHGFTSFFHFLGHFSPLLSVFTYFGMFYSSERREIPTAVNSSWTKNGIW